MPAMQADMTDGTMTQTRGFTLAEMLAVLAVITILAMMAIPSYLDKVVRAQIDAALPLADVAKGPVATYWAATQTLPTNNEAAALPAADKVVNNYVSSVTVTDGAIHLTLGNRASKAVAGKILTLRPAVVEDAPKNWSATPSGPFPSISASPACTLTPSPCWAARTPRPATAPSSGRSSTA